MNTAKWLSKTNNQRAAVIEYLRQAPEELDLYDSAEAACDVLDSIEREQDSEKKAA